MTKQDPYRPLFHFTPPFGWMNDPNGLVYHRGEFHLCYQYYPMDTVWGPMHWGHAVSRDLLSWEHLPIALAPDAAGMCFSGTATADAANRTGLVGPEGGLLAYYTIAAEKSEGDRDFPQSQGLAYSIDGGRRWQRYAGNPVLPNPGLQDFRDPKVFWHEPSQHWIMVVTLGQKVGIYRSADGLDWRFCSEFGEGEGAHDHLAWECPDLFEIPVAGSDESRWILIVGIQRQAYVPGSGTQYFVGHFDGERFVNDNTADTVLWLDYGRDYYASQTWAEVPAEDGRRLVLGWMSCWPYANQTPTANWRSAMSLPQTLTLKATDQGLRLHRAFVAELEAFERPERVLACGEVGAGELLAADWPEAARLQLALELAEGSELRISPTGEADFILFRRDGRLGLRSRRRGRIGVAEFDEHYPHDYELDLGAPRPLSLDLLLDRCSAELLLDDGRYGMTQLLFGDSPRRCRLAVERGSLVLEQGHWLGLSRSA
ncbi:glycosyl hydrolase family 32 [Zobellella denitrificans]|uniref:glycoside hydrolase family 32 protein n=1 Tax=Zobellella denitrificans TaxID=347534 RepID=UPI000B8C68C0|nr:glycoside hydrolase family 32 protein [Zobellella denitrificans]OXS15905.1 glycosyl hydrolase family 32 [Zobellella denitrificans]